MSRPIYVCGSSCSLQIIDIKISFLYKWSAGKKRNAENNQQVKVTIENKCHNKA